MEERTELNLTVVEVKGQEEAIRETAVGIVRWSRLHGHWKAWDGRGGGREGALWVMLKERILQLRG